MSDKKYPNSRFRLLNPVYSDANSVCLDKPLSRMNLQLQLGSSPMSPLGIVSDRVTGLHANPLRYGSVLLLLFSKLPLDSESLVRSLREHLR